MLGQAKSMMVVVPPRSAAREPLAKSSAVVVLHTSRSKCVWASMNPGNSSIPDTSNIFAPMGERSRPTAMIFSPSTSMSARRAPRPVTTEPPLNNDLIT